MFIYERNYISEHYKQDKKKLFFTPFISKIADLHKNLKVYGAEKKAVTLCYGPEVQGLSLLNGFEK